MNWTDRPGSSVRADGARVGEWFTNGKSEWWGYPAAWRPRCELTALGPYSTRAQAKYAVDTSLNLEIAQ